MQYSEENGTFIIKLDSGEEVVSTLEKICGRASVVSGAIVWGIGMLKNAEIGYLKGREYVKMTVKQNAEVVSFHGSIADSTPKFHIHVSVALEDHSVVGGHLFQGIVDPMMEIQVIKLNSVHLSRTLNPASGLKELQVSLK